MEKKSYTLGIDIGSTTVKIAILDEDHSLLFADYERHYANIQETLASLIGKAKNALGDCLSDRSSPVPAVFPWPITCISPSSRR